MYTDDTVYYVYTICIEYVEYEYVLLFILTNRTLEDVGYKTSKWS